MLRTLVFHTPQWFKTLLMVGMLLLLSLLVGRGVQQTDNTFATYDLTFKDHEKRITALEQLTKDVGRIDRKMDWLIEHLMKQKR